MWKIRHGNGKLNSIRRICQKNVNNRRNIIIINERKKCPIEHCDGTKDRFFQENNI